MENTDYRSDALLAHHTIIEMQKTAKSEELSVFDDHFNYYFAQLKLNPDKRVSLISFCASVGEDNTYRE